MSCFDPIPGSFSLLSGLDQTAQRCRTNQDENRRDHVPSTGKREQQVVAGVDNLPLIRVGQRHAPALVQRLEALERRAPEVVHDHPHRARRPVIPDILAAEALLDLGRNVGPHDVTAVPAPRLLVGNGGDVIKEAASSWSSKADGSTSSSAGRPSAA